jgi:secondary thiamine-phosphate synthase enzyme
MKSTVLTIATRRKKQVLDVTEPVSRWLAGAGAQSGLVHLFVQHTTAALTVGEAIEGTDEDLMDTLVAMIPKLAFRHGHDPSHAPDHMISSIVGPSLTVPVVDGELALGTWQRVLLVESNGPRQRTLVASLIE